MKRRLLISFSGGETSAYMTWWILTNLREQFDEIIIIFANTGQENEETLVFVDQCDRLLFAPLGFRVTYLEAVQFHGVRKRATFRIVSFESADRSGRVFEDMIAKYGIPNSRFKHCTRDLKLAPIHAYAESLGWRKGTYNTAIGIRADEIDRISSDAAEYGIIYPLIKLHPRRKPQINSWFAAQPFRLNLKGYQGNCRWCWKKSMRKHLTLIQEDPEQFEFPRRMEKKYGLHGAEFRRAEQDRDYILADDYRRVFFRGSRSTEDLLAHYEGMKGNFVTAKDDAIIFDPELDVGGGCEESCEVFSDEDMRLDDEAHELVAWIALPIEVSRHPILWFAIAA